MLKIIIVNIEDWALAGGQLLGQFGSKVVLKVADYPSCQYENAEGLNIKIKQRCLPGKLGEELSLQEITEALVLIEDLGDYSNEAETLNELRIMKQLTDAEMAIVAVYEEVLNIG